MTAVTLGLGCSVAVAACGNQNPNITVSYTSTPRNYQDTGVTTSTMPATVSTSTGIATTSTTTVGTVTNAQTVAVTTGRIQTLALITDTQNELLRMYTDVHALQSAYQVTLQQARSDLDGIRTRTTSLANRAKGQLPASNPARPLIVEADLAVSSAASTLEHIPAGASTAARLGALEDPVRKLQVDIGRIGSEVTTKVKADIHDDISKLGQKVAAVTGAGAGSGAVSSTTSSAPSSTTSTSGTVTTAGG